MRMCVCKSACAGASVTRMCGCKRLTVSSGPKCYYRVVTHGIGAAGYTVK